MAKDGKVNRVKGAERMQMHKKGFSATIRTVRDCVLMESVQTAYATTRIKASSVTEGWFVLVKCRA